MKTLSKSYTYAIIEGEHKGHSVVTDCWGIDFGGRDPKTAGWCVDCDQPVELVFLEDGGKINEAARKSVKS